MEPRSEPSPLELSSERLSPLSLKSSTVSSQITAAWQKVKHESLWNAKAAVCIDSVPGSHVVILPST